jgi:L-Lysine epsilon oxidase N-terminal/L-lysine epsilon oxidase C-terminal domain
MSISENTGTDDLSSASIVSLAVYPPVGIARVGNATGPDDYVVAAEVIGSQPTRPDGQPAVIEEDFRASDGRIKRQAVRFRIYAHLRDGSVFELTVASGVKISWRVNVANLKAGWYEFNQAMDLPRGLSKTAVRRNATIPIPGRPTHLDIVPTLKSIEGPSKSGDEFAFDDGMFWNSPVYLGEIRTDEEGRLLVFGGRGVSAAFRDGLRPTTFANNVGWHDDVADGSVRATVTFADGSTREADPGYVAVTPPNFAPGIFGLVTMDDTVREVYYSSGWAAPPTASSFTQDIWPIFDRLTGLQWVNHRLFVLHGLGSPLDARNTDVINRLRDATKIYEPWRKRVLGFFRDPNSGGAFREKALPQIFGDAYGEIPSKEPQDILAYLAVCKTQFEHLERWAAGEFVDDWVGIPVLPAFSDLSPATQIEHLNRAPLHECLGGPFHPGIELTWTMRIPLIWKGAYRLNVLPADGPAKQDFGPVLTPDVCCGRNGPFDGVAAGSLTRFLGVPWQTDGASCNSDADYSPSTFLSMPTFWGARVPDQVLALESYSRAAAVGKSDSPEQFYKHLMLRVDWLRDVRGFDYYERISHMVKEWWELGMVLPVPGAGADFPDDIRIEQGRNSEFSGSDPKPAFVAAVENLNKAGAVPEEALKGVLGVQPEDTRPPKRQYRQGEI